MGRSAVLQEVRIMRFEDVYGRFQRGRLNCEEAADLLGVWVSTFGRYRRRYEREGAAGLIDLLDRRYGMTAHLVELDGHVVAEAVLPGGERYLIDPTAGVLLPFGLDAAPAALDEIRAVYQAAGQVGLSTTYDAAGNVRLAEPGTRPFRPRLYWIERGSDVAKWALPAAMIAAGTMLWPRRRRG